MADKTYRTLNDAGKLWSNSIGAYCSVQVGKMTDAYRYALNATASGRGDANAWRVRFTTEMSQKRHVDAVTTLEQMAARNPDAVNGLKLQWIGSLYRTLDNLPDKTPLSRFLAVAASPVYQPDEQIYFGDGFKRERAILLAEAGDKTGATALLSGIVDPQTMARASLDKRLREVMPANYDFARAAERHLAQLREIAGSHSNSLGAVNDLASLLRLLGRPEESVATLEATRPDGPQRALLTDLDDQENWWWDGLARSYLILGRYDDAVAAFRVGMKSTSEGSVNVSQTINLAAAQLRFHHPDQALETLSVFKAGEYSASPYGEMQIRVVRGCVYSLQNNKAAAQAEIDYIRKHDKDDPAALMTVLLYAGDMDGAAASLIRRLDDPDRRISTLYALSEFRPQPGEYPQTLDESRLVDLKKRPDIQAAIERAGGTRSFPFQPSEL